MFDNLQKDRLIKLIRLLSSSSDGECLGAVRGIERTLKAAGLSFHELAETIAGRIIEVEKIKTVERIKEVRVEVEVNSAEKWLEACDALLKTGRLSDNEQEFVEDMQARYRFSSTWQASPRQVQWFVKICRQRLGTP